MIATELLNYVLELMRSNRNNAEILDQLLKQGVIHSSFEQRYLLNNVNFEFELVKMVTSEDESLVQFYLSAEDNSPYRMEFVYEKRWYLKSFLFQCPGCFGEDEECGVCGGSGWGAL